MLVDPPYPLRTYSYENVLKGVFPGVGPYDIPPINPTFDIPKGTFIALNQANSKTTNPEMKCVHCFIEDAHLCRLWNAPERYLDTFSTFEAICSPDFSLYINMPVALQIYNHYRKHWLAAMYQLNGIRVYPSIAWSDERSFDWCFDGEPRRSVVAVSSVGTQDSPEGKKAFLRGYEEMLKRLDPSAIIFHGLIPEECRAGNLIPILSHSEVMRRRLELHDNNEDF